MDIALPTPLLGGLTPARFMRRHWQKKPLLVRGAVADARALLQRARLFELASQPGVESRLITQQGERWTMRQGPLPRRALPALHRPGWTVLVHGVDLHLAAAHELLRRFRFIPDARLDDVMVSYASDGGGVGAHIDSYDVFLLQLHGRRRWRIGRAADPELRPDVPLRILANFSAEAEWLLDAGDMLYLPPGWAHEGVAQGECITCSIGFRSPTRGALTEEILQRMLDDTELADADPHYRDPGQLATAEPGRIPAALHEFAAASLQRFVADRHSVARALGEVLSEPKPGITFDARTAPQPLAGVRLDPRSRMLYDDWHVHINGDAFRAGGRDARLMRRLADQRALAPREVAALSAEARDLLGLWLAAGWLVTAGQ